MTGRRISLCAALILLLAGCGGTSSAGSTGTAGAAAPATTAGVAATTTEAATAEADCDAAKTVQDAVHDSHITKISVDGGCSQVAIETSLVNGAAGSGAAARKICEAAAKVAYVGNLSSVTVTATDKHELAAGEKGIEGCIGAP